MDKINDERAGLTSYRDKSEHENTKSTSTHHDVLHNDMQDVIDQKCSHKLRSTNSELKGETVEQKTSNSDRNKPTKQSTLVHDSHVLELHRTDQSDETGSIFLPRLTGNNVRTLHEAKQPIEGENQDDKSTEGNGEQFHLPNIHVECSRSSRIALQRSITDLLDPEMEIINKIKRGSKKKKKKRKIKQIDNESKTDNIFEKTWLNL